jgi:hypothetical protein
MIPNSLKKLILDLKVKDESDIYTKLSALESAEYFASSLDDFMFLSNQYDSLIYKKSMLKFPLPATDFFATYSPDKSILERAQYWDEKVRIHFQPSATLNPKLTYN